MPIFIPPLSSRLGLFVSRENNISYVIAAPDLTLLEGPPGAGRALVTVDEITRRVVSLKAMR